MNWNSINANIVTVINYLACLLSHFLHVYLPYTVVILGVVFIQVNLFYSLTVNRRLDEWVKLEQLDLDSVETVVDEKVEDKVIIFVSLQFYESLMCPLPLTLNAVHLWDPFALESCLQYSLSFFSIEMIGENVVIDIPGNKLENDTPPETEDWRDACGGILNCS